jgi:hypothetical protein
MSLEKSLNDREKEGRRDFLKGLALGASSFIGASAGAIIKFNDEMDRIKARVLSPAVIDELKKLGATDTDIVTIEKRLKPLLLDELQRVMNGR